MVIGVRTTGREACRSAASMTSWSVAAPRQFRSVAESTDRGPVCPAQGRRTTGRKRLMVKQSPGDSTSGAAEGQGLRLSGGAIASLTGVGLLLIFMIQNTEDVTLDFLFWSFTWPLLAFFPRDGVVRGVGVVWIWRDAPSSAPQGATRRPTGLTCASSDPPHPDRPDRSPKESTRVPGPTLPTGLRLRRAAQTHPGSGQPAPHLVTRYVVPSTLHNATRRSLGGPLGERRGRCWSSPGSCSPPGAAGSKPAILTSQMRRNGGQLCPTDSLHARRSVPPGS